MKATLKRLVVQIVTWEAKLLLAKHKPTIVGITGNVGKTSTKDAIYSVLKPHLTVRKSQKSFNSELGVPLTILGLNSGWSSPVMWAWNIIDGLFTALLSTSYPDVLVLEMGVDRPGDMKQLASWVRPDIVVLTRFPDVPTHVEFFGGPDEVAAEKMELVHGMKTDGVVVYNHDDMRIRALLEDVRQETIGYSRFSASQYQVSNDTIAYENDMPVGLTCTVTHIDESTDVQITGTLGVPMLYVSAAALAVAGELGISLADAAAAVAKHEPSRGRLRVLRGHNDTTIIDDTYNASPVAVQEALQLLHEIKTDGRRIAVLGDMLELGRFSVSAHETVGETAAEVVDELCTVGVRARTTAQAALSHGLSEKHIRQYDLVDRAAREVRAMLQPGDVVLVKASQGIRLEKVVREIMAEPAQASQCLVRQDAEWLAR